MVRRSNNLHKSGAGSSVKFLCSYGGKILPRCTDGKLRYVGGETRVLAVDRSVSFPELLVKLGELCGSFPVSLRCQLPMEDLDALVSITSDEDLANLIDEYDRASQAASVSVKIRAFLSPPKSIKKISPPPSSATSSSSAAIRSGMMSFLPAGMVADRCVHQISKPMEFPVCCEKFSGKKVEIGRVGGLGTPGWLRATERYHQTEISEISI